MNEDKKPKKVKHRPNQKGIGMRVLNEHDADSYDEYLKTDLDHWDEWSKENPEADPGDYKPPFLRD